MWPTAAAHDAKDTGAKAEYERKSPGLTATGHLLQMQMSGARSLPKDRTLNPRFVEWLMGWPIAWTDCDSQVTEWFLVKPLKL
jgi:DNA (cytosine-5)-methyltransferase 1